MADSFCETTFGFRFLSLSEYELSRLRNLLPNVHFTSRPRGAAFVVTFDLNEDFELDPLLEFISESRIDQSMFSIWISLISSSDQGGVALPSHVLAVIRRTSGGVDFSFASCLGNGSCTSEE